jgi:hypothetical protein
MVGLHPDTNVTESDPLVNEDPEIAELSEKWSSDWRFWRSNRSDGRPGILYASRVRTLSPTERSMGLLALIPTGFAQDDARALREQLVAQAQIQADSSA